MAMTSVRIPDELADQLEKMASLMRRKKGWLITEALREYLEKHARQQRMLKETQDGIASIEAGDIHSEDEINRWLDTWGSPEPAR